MAKITKSMTIIFFILLLLALGRFYLNRSNQEEELKEVPAAVTVVKGERGSLSRAIRLTGISESRSTVTLLSRIGGLLKELPAAMGDEVEAGEVVARIDDEVYRLTLAQAEAALSGAEATFRRVETLSKSNSVTPQSYDEARAAYEAARSQYALARLNLDWCEIISPIKGTVLETHLGEGDLVSPQRPLMTVAELDHPEIRLKVPEEYYGRFRESRETMTIKARIPAMDEREFSCRVIQIAPWIAPESKTFELLLGVEDPGGLIRPGMFAAVFVELDKREDVVFLEWHCLDSEGNLWYLDEDQRPRKMKYQPALTGEEGFQVPPGMEDTFFIAQGHHFLTEGQNVRVLER